MNLKKGFTLIELLVVVAIIGILASVVLASLNSARAKGADAAVKANLANIRAQAELIYDTVETPTDSVGYAGVCTHATVDAAVSAAATAGGATVGADDAAATATTAVCQDSAAVWVVEAPLKTAGKYWCVDSAGASKEVSTLIAANATSCP